MDGTWVKSRGTSPCIRRASWCKISTWARLRDESSLGRSDRAAVYACVLPTTILLSHWAAEHCLYWLGEILHNHPPTTTAAITTTPPLRPYCQQKTGPRCRRQRVAVFLKREKQTRLDNTQPKMLPTSASNVHVCLPSQIRSGGSAASQ